MRFQNYINERVLGTIKGLSPEKIIKTAKPWFDLCKRNNVENYYLWRGTNYIIPDVRYLKVRTNREPMSTCKEIHKISDSIFYKEFGIKARSETLFCFPDWREAKSYGTYVNIIIPIGKFDFIWSKKIKDFYGRMGNSEFYDILCSDDLYDLENEWETNNGPSTGEGTWWYDGKDTGEVEIEDAVEVVVKKLKNKGIIDNENIEYYRDAINVDLDWVPTQSFDEYIDELQADGIEYMENTIKNNYVKNKYFKELMDNQFFKANEVMLYCKAYYLINENWALENLKNEIDKILK